MKFPFRQVHGFEDVQRNFEAIEQQNLWVGKGAPTFIPGEGTAYYFRTDTPGTANQRLYVFNGSTWTGIL